jgi:Protein of unknown function DUF262
MASRVRFNVNAMTAHELISMLIRGEMVIPNHQRDYCWDVKRQGAFIKSIGDNIPTQSIILRKVGRGPGINEGDQTSLEDGQQRLTTLKRFMADELPEAALTATGGRKFSELSADQQSDIRAYQFSVVVYRGATIEQEVAIFDHFQNGLPLTKGERLHSMSEISPLVGFVKKQLMTAAQGLHNEAALVWGARAGTDKRRKALLNATALCAGLAFGSEGLTKKWSDYTENGYLSRRFDEDDVMRKLRTIISIYQQVETRHPERKKSVLNSQWDVGKYTGYIVYSLNVFPDDTDRLVRGWVNFLTDARAHPERITDILHRDLTKARSWNVQRWEMGYLRVFNPAEATRRAEALVAPDSDDDDDSDD